MDENKTETKIEDAQPTGQVQSAQSETQPSQEETPQQIDWRKFKEARKREREAKEAAERDLIAERQRAEAFKNALDALVNKPGSIETEQSEDERIQKRIDEALAKQRAKEDAERAAKEKAETPYKLAQVYPDFDQVCSAENLDYLEYHYPEVARSLNYAPDGFQKWSDVYKAVKRFIPNSTTSNKEQKKAEKNLTKPQAMSMQGMTASGDQAPKYLGEKQKEANWKRMVARMKGIG